MTGSWCPKAKMNTNTNKIIIDFFIAPPTLTILLLLKKKSSLIHKKKKKGKMEKKGVGKKSENPIFLQHLFIKNP
jgi:hypothetical protein